MELLDREGYVLLLLLGDRFPPLLELVGVLDLPRHRS
jgi:hypothetical protein